MSPKKADKIELTKEEIEAAAIAIGGQNLIGGPSGLSADYVCMMVTAVNKLREPTRPGDSTIFAHNLDADTDMGDLYDHEFAEFFPAAMPITQEQAHNRTVTDRDWLVWIRERKLKEQSQEGVS